MSQLLNQHSFNNQFVPQRPRMKTAFFFVPHLTFISLSSQGSPDMIRMASQAPSQDQGSSRAPDKPEPLTRRRSHPLTRSRPLTRSSLSSPTHLHARRARVSQVVLAVTDSECYIFRLCSYMFGVTLLCHIQKWVSTVSVSKNFLLTINSTVDKLIKGILGRYGNEVAFSV